MDRAGRQRRPQASLIVMLTALPAGGASRVVAEYADRSGTFVCPGCAQPVVLKRGRLRVAHFAHTAHACSVFGRETAAHLGAKQRLLSAFRARHLKCEAEVEVLSNDGDRRADLLVYSPQGQRVAIEVQHSPLTLEAIAARTRAYAAAGVPVLWLPVLDVSRRTDAKKVRGADIVRVARYRAPAWQRWISGYQFGRIWFYDAQLDALWRGRFAPVPLWRLGHGAGAPRRPVDARAFRVLELEGPIPLSSVRVAVRQRPESQAGSYYFPAGAFAFFVCPGEHPADPLAMPLRVQPSRRLGRARPPRLELLVDGEWQPARLEPYRPTRREPGDKKRS